MNTAASPSPAGRLLCVDDEPSILSALRRLFRPEGYQVLTAESGAEGLAILEKEPVDLVISDMRMPEMDGAEFLEKVRERWPDTVRILLTGYADIGATVAAINRGQIWRYIAKPWNDDEIRHAVRMAIEHRRLQQENARLLALTQRQNEALKALNAGLEEKVKERTAELQKALASLEQAHGRLKKSFLTMVRVMTGLFELRSKRMAGHSRRVAETAQRIARALGLEDGETQDILLAALLHDIGKFGQSDLLLGKPFSAMTPSERAEVMQHPERGEMLLSGIDQLRQAATLVRHHHECFDGSGYPDHLVGLAIPLGARILAVANDFDALQMGTLVSRPLRPAEARNFILENRGKRYDPQVVDAFLTLIAEEIAEELPELPLRPGSAKPGMVLTRDLVHPDGYLLLARGQTLDQSQIDQLLRIERSEDLILTLHVQPPAKN